MNTSELIRIVRNKLIEFNENSISDTLILDHMGSIYRHIYNYYARSQDNHFGQDFPLTVKPGVFEYELPRNLWNKRVQSVHAPLPVTDPAGYSDVPKINRNNSHLYETPKGNTLIPSAYEIYGSTLKILSKPQNSYDLRLFIIPLLVPLAPTAGEIISISAGTILCADDLCSEFASYASKTNGKNILSISDGITGEVKHVFEFNDVVDNLITLTNPTVRTSIKTRELSTLATDVSDVFIDDVVTLGYSTGVSIFSEAVDTLLETYTTKSVKASLKESNDLTNDIYKELLDELNSDKVGRPSIDTIVRVQRVPAYASRVRR